MSTLWIAQALAVSALITLGGAMGSEVARLMGRPRRWVWTFALALAVLLPLFGGRMARHFGANPLARMLSDLRHQYVPPSVAAGAIETAAATVLPSLFAGAWVAASVILLFTMLWSQSRLRALRSSGPAMHIGGVRVSVTERFGPGVAGLFHPGIMVPRWILDFPQQDLELVVEHERQHVLAGDSRLLVLAGCLLVAMPWNPFVWWLHRRLQLAVETDCDARVLSTGVDTGVYGQLLIKCAAYAIRFPVSSPALARTTTILERRIRAMTEVTSPNLIPRVALTATAGLVMFTAACEIAGPAPLIEPESSIDPEVRISAVGVHVPEASARPLVSNPPRSSPPPESLSSRRHDDSEGALHFTATIRRRQ